MYYPYYCILLYFNKTHGRIFSLQWWIWRKTYIWKFVNITPQWSSMGNKILHTKKKTLNSIETLTQYSTSNANNCLISLVSRLNDVQVLCSGQSSAMSKPMFCCFLFIYMKMVYRNRVQCDTRFSRSFSTEGYRSGHYLIYFCHALKTHFYWPVS